nr:MAG TPA: hypothetical protein [Caudoviricetes sp.]
MNKLVNLLVGIIILLIVVIIVLIYFEIKLYNMVLQYQNNYYDLLKIFSQLNSQIHYTGG